MEENNQLRKELAEREEELKKYSCRSDFEDGRKEDLRVKDAQINQAESEWDGPQGMGNHPALGSLGTVDLHQNGFQRNDTVLKNTARGHHYLASSGNGFAKLSHGGLEKSNNPGTSQLSSSSSASISPIRLRKGDFDAITNLSEQVQPQMSEINKHQSEQELILTVKDHKEEILQLRKHVADYSIKEAEARNEKYVLEKRIAQMRMAFDQQQQELVDAASKALSYREDIIKENIHLTYALQAAQQEGSTYKSSLLPLLSEYDLQPHNPDAHSIVSNLKVLFRHFHEKLIIAEEKLKESPYQITSHAETSKANNLNLTPQPPAHTFGVMKNGLEIVPQTMYSNEQSPTPFSDNLRTDLDSLGHQAVHDSSDIFNSTNNMERSPMNRAPAAEEAQTTVVGRQDRHVENFNSEAKSTGPLFKDNRGMNEMDDSGEASQSVGDLSLPLVNSRSPYVSSGFDDLTGPSCLTPVLEEPDSSFSQAAEDDPLPAIHGLQLSGEPYPGRELKASGYSINGTTHCNFEWVRYWDDCSVSRIEGAQQQHTYLVSADDVDCYLAVRVQPVDGRNRKGELIELPANDSMKILCDPEMQEQIGRILSDRNASFEVSIYAGFVNIWERAVLGIKNESYSIKSVSERVVAERFSPKVEIVIQYGRPVEFFIRTSGGDEYLLMPSPSSNSNRDTIVLTMRMFKKRAIEKRNRRRIRFF